MKDNNANWAWVKLKLRKDRKFFFEFILGHYAKTKTIGALHSEWFELLTNERKLGIVAPRGHAKSTIINLADNLFDICNGYEPYIVIFSDTPEQATEHLGAIVEELEGNERLIEFYGQLYDKRAVGELFKEKWTQTAIITKNGVKVEAKGWRSKTRGMRWKEFRPSKIVIDDVENDEDVASQRMRRKLKNTFEKKILNLGEPECKYRFVGTILHFDSLLQNEYKKPRNGWTWKFYKAYKEDESPLWPEWWTRERLESRRKEVGDISFNQEFLNNPLDSSTQIFKPVEFYESIDLSMVECYAYIDLAISEKETADYTSIVTIGRHKNSGKLYVIEPVRIRGSITEQLQLVFDMNRKYNYQNFGVESVAYQKAFAQVLKEKSNQMRIYIPVTEVQIDKDKIRRAIEITPHVENGTIVFNASHQEFMAELAQFPKAEHDDYVDAFVGAVRIAMQSSMSGYTIRTMGTSIYNGNE
jgi:predicted phage terminase large subunit-like protein